MVKATNIKVKMIEIFEILWSAKIELRVIIVATPIIFGLIYWREKERQQKEKKQARLNSVKLKI